MGPGDGLELSYRGSSMLAGGSADLEATDSVPIFAVLEEVAERWSGYVRDRFRTIHELHVVLKTGPTPLHDTQADRDPTGPSRPVGERSAERRRSLSRRWGPLGDEDGERFNEDAWEGADVLNEEGEVDDAPVHGLDAVANPLAYPHRGEAHTSFSWFQLIYFAVVQRSPGAIQGTAQEVLGRRKTNAGGVESGGNHVAVKVLVRDHPEHLHANPLAGGIGRPDQGETRHAPLIALPHSAGRHGAS